MTSSDAHNGNGSVDESTSWQSEISLQVDDIRKSPEDERLYRAVELRNGIKILAISDPTTDKSAACLDVRVGFLADPAYLPGLAHFCEHMLFLGTKKFPEENYFEKFVHEHGGYSNAETDLEHTSYYYEVHPSHLSESLHVFASFFQEPLFSETALQREVEAVQAEDEASAKDDGCRLAQVELATSDQQHPFTKFGAGNRRTLTEFIHVCEQHETKDGVGASEAKKRKLEARSTCSCQVRSYTAGATLPASWSQRIRGELLAFYERAYSSNLMTMCVLGSQSLDELSAMAISCFSVVLNRSLPIRAWPSPFATCHLGILVRAIPLTNVRQLELTFPLPDLSARYPAKPAYYISHLLANEAPRGLLAELKRRGLANSMEVSLAESLTGFWLLKIVFELTDAALARSSPLEVEPTVDLPAYEIVEATFQYIALIRERGVDQGIFDELSRLAEIEFRFDDKLDPLDAAINGAADLHDYAMRDVLVGGVLLDQFDEALIRKLLSHMHPHNLRLLLVAKSLDLDTADSSDKPAKRRVDWQTEKWYGARYHVERLSEDVLRRWQHAGTVDCFQLPERNAFIPSSCDFQLVHPRNSARASLAGLALVDSVAIARADAPLPTLLVDDDRVRCWFARDCHFHVPKTTAYFQLLAPRVASSSPLHACALDLLVALLSDAEPLAALAHAASVAGLSFDLRASSSGCAIFMTGYLSTLRTLLDSVLVQLVSYKVDVGRFEALRDAYRRELQDDESAPTDAQADCTVGQLLASRAWSAADRLQVLHQLTPDAIEHTHRELLAELFVESLVFGNVLEQDALQLLRAVRDRLNFSPARLTELDRVRQVSLRVQPQTRAYYRFERVNHVQAVSTVHVYLQIGIESLSSVVSVSLLQHLLSEAFFDQLRTREQLGYSLDCATRLENGCVGLSLFVATRRDLRYVECRIERFIAAQLGRIRSMSAAEFEKHRGTFVRELLVRPKQLVAQADDLWDEVACCLYDFSRPFAEAHAASLISQSELIAFCDSYVAIDAPLRAKLVVFVHGKGQLEVAPKRQNNSQSNGRISSARDRRNVCSRARVSDQHQDNDASDVDLEHRDDDSQVDSDESHSSVSQDAETQALSEDNRLTSEPTASSGYLQTQHDASEEFELGEPTIIDDVHRFKARLPLFALPRSAVSLPSHGRGMLLLDELIGSNALSKQSLQH